MVGDKERLEAELTRVEGDLFDAVCRRDELEEELACAETRIAELEAEVAAFAQIGLYVK